MNQTLITQIIPTIQGEGPSIGTLVLLIRLGNCNLCCSMCDSKWSNNLKIDNISKFDPKKIEYPFVLDDDDIMEFVKFLNKEFLYKYRIHTILITGGEPFMNKSFIRRMIFNQDLSELSYISKIEIESNGVLIDDPDDYKLFEHWGKTFQINISPKLNPKFYRSDKISSLDDIINLFNNNIKNSIDKIVLKTPTTINWKFVYSKSAEADIETFIQRSLLMQNISIMPLTPNYRDFENEMEFLEAFRKVCYDAIKYCLNTGYVFTPRAHILIFNNFLHRNEYVDVLKGNNEKI